MKAYQIKINGEKFSIPFTHHDECLVMLAKMDFENDAVISVEEVEIKSGDYYREGNTIICDSIIRGCYYNDHAEHI